MKKLLLIFIAGSLFTVSCKKDDPNEPEPDPTPTTSNLSSYFDDNLNDKKQSFTINAGTYNQFTGENGVSIIVPANSFVTAGGTPVTGNITMSLIEILDQKNMILSGMPTTSNGQILISGGQINLTAKQGTTPVYLADNASIGVMMPAPNPDFAMQLFDGVVDSDGDVDWILSTDSTGTADSITVINDSLGAYYYFDWADSGLGWINCDYFYSSPDPLTTVHVSTDSAYNQTNTAVFLHFSDINSIAQLWHDGTYFSSYNNSIPLNMSVTVVCISEIDGNYYSAFVPVTVTSNIVVPVTMSPTTLGAFETAVGNL